MGHKSIPDQAEPLLLDSAESGNLSFLEPTLQAAEPTVFLRIVASNDVCAPPPLTQAPPRIRLSADTTTFVELPKAPDSAPITDAGVVVGNASWAPDGPGVYRVVVLVDRPGSVWELKLTNAHTEPLSFTATVAGTDEEARMPWIQLPETVSFGTVTVDSMTTASVHVHNRGSKTLIVEGVGGSTVQIGPHLCDDVPLTFSESSVGRTSRSFDIKSNATNNGSVQLEGDVVHRHQGGSGPIPLSPTEPLQ